MSSDQDVVDDVVARMNAVGAARARKMFGEYGVYCEDLFVGVVCGNQLYLKATDSGRRVIPGCPEGPPYEGARDHLVIEYSVLADPAVFGRLLRATVRAVRAAERS